MSKAYYGDNLEVMRTLGTASIDLIYLDPPFNSSRNYNATFNKVASKNDTAQVKAFEDTWHWDTSTEQMLYSFNDPNSEYYKHTKTRKLMNGLIEAFGKGSLTSYLLMLAPRLIEMKRLLKDTGSIYLHCDPTASHSIKLLMDSVFGEDNFRNEIVWRYGKMANASKKMSENHDIIFFYAMSDKTPFYPLYINDSEYKERYKKYVQDNKVYYKDVKDKRDKLISGRIKKLEKEYNRDLNDEDILFDFDKEKKAQDDVWYDIAPALKGNSKERIGYPTQKPKALIKHILSASSKEGDSILDPFCGCGTTIVAAMEMKRNCIGIDNSEVAISFLKNRFNIS